MVAEIAPEDDVLGESECHADRRGAEAVVESQGLVIREHREAKVPTMTQDDLGAKAGYKTGAAFRSPASRAD